MTKRRDTPPPFPLIDLRSRRMGALSLARRGASVDDIADITAAPVAQVRRDIILEAARQRCTAAAAARLAGTSRAYAARVLARAGKSEAARIDARRRRVALYTARGLAARDIAARLRVSVRTVQADRRVLQNAF